MPITAAQTGAKRDGPNTSPLRRLAGGVGGLGLLALLSLPACAHAVLPELPVPVGTDVARMAATVVSAGVPPTSTPTVAVPLPSTGPVAPTAKAPDAAAGPSAPPAAHSPAGVPAVSRSTRQVPAPAHRDAPAAAGRSAAPATGTGGVAGRSAAHATGTGGVPARAEQMGMGAARERRVPVRATRRDAAVRGGFALRPQAGPAETALDLSAPASSRPAGLISALQPLGSSPPIGGGWLVGLLILFTGTTLIALMCADAIGLGPRHDYLRRRRARFRRHP